VRFRTIFRISSISTLCLVLFFGESSVTLLSVYMATGLCFVLGGKVVIPGPSELQSVLLGCLNSDFAIYICISSAQVFPSI